MKILMGLIFYPRGGSAQVARYLSRALIELGHEVHLTTGTLHDDDPQHDANAFFGEIPLTLVDYTDAWRGFGQGEDPLSDKWEAPFHPSYEDKSGVPDRGFCRLTERRVCGIVAVLDRSTRGGERALPARRSSPPPSHLRSCRRGASLSLGAQADAAARDGDQDAGASRRAE